MQSYMFQYTAGSSKQGTGNSSATTTTGNPMLASKTKNFWFMTVGHSTVPYCQAVLFTPRRYWIDTATGENVKSSEGFYKTVQMDEVNCYEYIVSKWTSLQQVFSQLDQRNRTVVNKQKGLFNSEQLRCILVLHDKKCENYTTETNYSKGQHFHCLFSSETIKSLSQDPLYRKVYREFTSNGDYCQISKVSGDATGILKYMYKDKEKFFMGSNCPEMLARFSDAQSLGGFFYLNIEYGLSGFEEVPFINFNENETNCRNKKKFQTSIKPCVCRKFICPRARCPVLFKE